MKLVPLLLLALSSGVSSWASDIRLAPEIMPPRKLRTYEVTDTSRPFTVRFSKGDSEVELKVDPEKRRVQFADTLCGQPAPPVWSLKGKHATFTCDKLSECMSDGDKPFAIENVRGLDRPYKVKAVVCYDSTADATGFALLPFPLR